MPYPSLLHPEPHPCGSPLLTHTTPGDTPTQFCLSLCGVPGSWCIQGLFEPSEHLCQEWGLILNVNSPFLPSCWDYFFALRHRVSCHSHSSAWFHHFMTKRWERIGNSGIFYFLGLTSDGDCSHEIKILLILGRKLMTNLDNILKSRDITLPTEVHTIKAMVFPVVMYRCDSWTIKKAEC